MRTVEVFAENREQAERVARGFDCPAVDAFLNDWEDAGSCRFIGTDAQGEVSVLIVSADRPGRAATPPIPD